MRPSIAILSTLLMSSCSKPDTPSEIPSTPKIEVTQQETPPNRFEEQSEWHRAIQMVVNQSNNEQAADLLKFFDQNGMLAQPVQTPNGVGMQVLTNANSPLWFLFIPLATQDAGLGGEWAMYVDTSSNENRSGAIAHFLPEPRAVIVKGNIEMSDSWKGVLALHEVFHANDYLTSPYPWQDPATFCTHEVAAHDFENELLLKLGGEKYQTYLDVEAQRMKLEVTSLGYDIGEAHAGRTEYDPDLDGIFGPTKSEAEKAARGTHTWIHANFLLLEDRFPSESAAKKAQFYCNITSSIVEENQ